MAERGCPDGGACWHFCEDGPCWRVLNCSPLSAYAEDWPSDVVAAECAKDTLRPHREPVDVHLWFGLSYSAYLCVNRSLLQSMPLEWQHRFTAVMDELAEHFANITEPSYTVHARDDAGRFIKDPIPHYNRGRTFVKGAVDVDT